MATLCKRTRIRLPTIQYRPIKKMASLSEIYDVGWECALAKKEGPSLIQNTVWVRCKDFLNDALWAHVRKKTVSIYGFSYGSKDPPLDTNQLVLLVRDKTVPVEQMLEGCKKARVVIRAFEKKLRFSPRVRLFQLKNDNDILPEFAFITGARWLTAPPLLSLFGCLARAGRFLTSKTDPLGFIKKVGRQEVSCPGNDPAYLAPSIKSGRFDMLLEEGLSLFSDSLEENYSAPDVHTVHYSGIQQWGLIMGTDQAKNKPYSFWK